jgi:hypothetical protein
MRTCIAGLFLFLTAAFCQAADKDQGEIKAFCIDFNWGEGGPNGFAKPGLWADADPEAHVTWYKELGVNVIQTFCVSCNGYAWYKNGFVPEQPGLKTDFLREMVVLGHKDGIKVMGYFCIGSNTRWGREHPDLSYGIPSAPHIPYTDEYLKYLDGAIRDAVKTTGIDGFMIDWVWQPQTRLEGGKWLECEKKLYEELMKEKFPGEDRLNNDRYNLYSRKAIERCWITIRSAAKETNPRCIIWLTCNDTKNPHVTNSLMFKEVDWLMNERGDIESINEIRGQVTGKTRLITCLAAWNKMDPEDVIPLALKEKIGLYGFVKPDANSLLPPVSDFLSKPIDSFTGDPKNIAALARTFRGLPLKDAGDKKNK